VRRLIQPSRRDLLRAGAGLPLSVAMAPYAMLRSREVPTAGKGITQLSFWGGWTGPDGAMMQRLVGLFNSTVRDAHVTLTLYNWDLIFDRWRQEFEGGMPPDIVSIHATEVAEYAARGMLRDIQSEAQRFLPDGADFFPPPWRLCHVDGGLYAIPLDIHPLGLYIDAGAARRAGLDPRRPPGTAAELHGWAARLTDATRGRWGYAAPAGDVECFRQWYSLLYQFGGRFMDPAGTRCLADSPAGVRAFAFLRDAILARRVAMPREGPVDADFIAGKVSMYLQGPWYIQGARRAGVELVTAPAPRIGPRPAVWANSHVLGVVNTSDRGRVEAAMRFIAWLNSRALDWAEAGQIPAHNGARARLRATRIWPYLRPFVAQLPSIVYQPNLIAHTRLFAESAPTPVISETQAVMLGRETPAEAVRAMSAQVDAIVASS
jgi:multiple sugar transport system substrate-binding protein